VVLERLRRELAGDLRNFAERVAPAHMALETREAELAGELVSKLLGSDPQLAAGLRMKMRLFTLSKTPGWFFPYRSFFGLFAFTAGAWDRLAFAMAGSLPSLALLAFQTARNAKRLGEMRDDMRNALAERIQSMAADELADSNRIFIRSIHSSLPSSEHSPETAPASTRFRGLERVTDASAEIFQSIVARHARSGWLPRLFGGLAPAAFVILLCGPLWAVYSEFRDAWLDVFAGSEAVRWQSFPAPSAGMILTTLLLVVLPVVVFALVSSVLATPVVKVDAAIEDAKKEHGAMLERMNREKTIRLVSDDPVREAVRFILGFLNGR
jgi:hypothetical protein